MILVIDEADAGGVKGTVTLQGMPEGGQTVAPLINGSARYDTKLGRAVFTAQSIGRDKASGEYFNIKFSGYRGPYARRLYLNVEYEVKFRPPTVADDGSWSQPCNGKVCGAFPMECVVVPCQCGQIQGLCWQPLGTDGTRFTTTAFLQVPGADYVQGTGVEQRHTFRGEDGQMKIERKYTFTFPGQTGKMIFETGHDPVYSNRMTLDKVRFTTYGYTFENRPPNPSDFNIWWNYYENCNCEDVVTSGFDTTDLIRQISEMGLVTATPTLTP